jgi:chemotaxis protein MotB
VSDRDVSVFEDEGAGYLVSVSDIMSGLLFVFIITLVAFVIQFQDAAEKKDKESVLLQQAVDRKEQEWIELQEASKKKDFERLALETASEGKEVERKILQKKVEQLTNNRAVRSKLLRDIERQLKDQGVEVEIDQGLGVLRLTEKTVLFRSNSTDLDPKPRENLRVISEVLSSIIPCYASTTRSLDYCDPETIGKLEAVFIEGHTDNVPIHKPSYTNWDLSAKRAISTYQFMLGESSILGELYNEREEPLFSVSGYSDQRPVVSYDVPTDDPKNRRIDIRFIMTPPKKTPDIIKAIQEEGVR